MKVIMLKDVAKIGRKGEVKEVSDGHAINFLIPKKFAEKATPLKMKEIEQKQKGLQELSKAQTEALAKTLQSLAGQVVEIKAKVNEKGHLYRELHEKDISAAIKESLGLSVPVENIKLESHLKVAGKSTLLAEGAGEKVPFEVNITS